MVSSMNDAHALVIGIANYQHINRPRPGHEEVNLMECVVPEKANG